MNNIANIENIGGNIISNEYYKWIDNELINLTNEEYENIIVNNSNTIKLTFPLGINGIISPIYTYTHNSKINLKFICKIINEFYNNEITEQEEQLLNNQLDEDLTFSNRMDIIEYTNLCYFQGIENNNDVYNILLGS